MGSSSFKAEWGPAICMVLIELFTTGQMLLTKVVVDAGLFVFALLTYRFFIGTVLVIPLAMIFERHPRHKAQGHNRVLYSPLDPCSSAPKEMERTKKEWWPATFMVLIQVLTTGQMLLTKVVVDDGLSVCTLLAYRFFMGAILVIPLAVIFEKGKLKELNLKAFIWIFTSALVGFTIPGLYYIGLGDTSPGYAINFYNIIPIATFILAVLFRKEPLNMRRLVGAFKVIGTLVCVGGTLVISLYKGKVIHLWPTNIIGYHAKHSGSAYGHHHMRGTILLVISCLSLAVWYTVQAQMLKVFPYKYWSTVATCFVGCIQMAVVGVAMNREKATWELKWNMSLLTIVYSAILNTAAKFVMISWVVTQRGPTYPSMFCAVSVLFTTVLDSLLLGHDLSVGSILGMIMILVGLYSFLWGKRKELARGSQEKPKDELQYQNEGNIKESGSNV